VCGISVESHLVYDDLDMHLRSGQLARCLVAGAVSVLAGNCGRGRLRSGAKDAAGPDFTSVTDLKSNEPGADQPPAGRDVAPPDEPADLMVTDGDADASRDSPPLPPP
jgi:hypothetical protein